MDLEEFLDSLAVRAAADDEFRTFERCLIERVSARRKPSHVESAGDELPSDFRHAPEGLRRVRMDTRVIAHRRLKNCEDRRLEWRHAIAPPAHAGRVRHQLTFGAFSLNRGPNMPRGAQNSVVLSTEHPYSQTTKTLPEMCRWSLRANDTYPDSKRILSLTSLGKHALTQTEHESEQAAELSRILLAMHANQTDLCLLTAQQALLVLCAMVDSF